MYTTKRVGSNHPDFIKLVQELDQELAERDGHEHEFYDQFNGVENIKHIVVLYRNETPIACGALKKFDHRCLEVKRMFVEKSYPGKQLGNLILQALEDWAKELDYKYLVLETGKRQPEAIAFYRKHHYITIPNYGPYINIENSVCFKKLLD